MTTITTVEAREHFSDMLNRTAYGKERIVVTRRGRELAAILPVEDLRLLEELEDLGDLREAVKALEEPGEISMEDLKKELGF
jgi:prevent-host-death family protein